MRPHAYTCSVNKASAPWPASKSWGMFTFSGIGRPIRSRLCKYTPRDSWIHFLITSRKKCVMIGLFLATCCLRHLLYLYPPIAIVAGSDLIGSSMRLQRLVPYTSDTPSVIRWRTHVVWTRRHGSGGKWSADGWRCKNKNKKVVRSRDRRMFNGQIRYLAQWAPFLICLGWNIVVDTEMLTIGPVSGIWLVSKRPCLLHTGWLWESQTCP